MKLTLKNKDSNLIDFDLVDSGLNHYSVFIEKVYDGVFPYGLVVSNEGLLVWLKRRGIPKNREFVNKILESLGLSYNDLEGILRVGKALSLNDTFWVVERGFKGLFKDYNLYENDFNRAVGLIAYTGNGYNNSIGTIPELTTHGTLRKAWRNTRNGIYLYKGGTHGFNNGGLEPYSEYYASQIAEAMGISHVSYGLEMWTGELASTCKLFTSIDVSYYSIYSMLGDRSITEYKEYFRDISKDAYNDFCSMMVFDALIYNVDRHLNNFGVLVESSIGRVMGMAPVFDNGFSLFDKASFNVYNMELLNEYRRGLFPSIGSTFEDNAKECLGDVQKRQLRSLIGFKFKLHDKYNLPLWRVKVLEDFIQIRIKELLNVDDILESRKVWSVDRNKEYAFDELSSEERKIVLDELQVEKDLDLNCEYDELSLEDMAYLFNYVFSRNSKGEVIGVSLIRKVG